MSTFRNISPERRIAGYGLRRTTPGGVWVDVDELIDVVDEADPSYECQPARWRKVDDLDVPSASTTDVGDHAAADSPEEGTP